MTRQRAWLFPVLVGLGALVPYLNSLHGEFLWDDLVLIRDNRHVHELRHIPDLFSESMAAGAFDAGAAGDTATFYRPLPMLTLALNHAASGLDPGGYHLTNVVVHILAALCVYWLLSIVVPGRIVALLAALLFATHPVNTEVVAYISGRDTGLAVLLLLVSLACFLESGRRRGRWWYPASLAAFSLSLLAKEFPVVGPLLLLAHLTILGRPTRAGLLRLAPFFAVDAAWVAAKLTVLRFGAEAMRGSGVAPLHRFTGFFASVPGYLQLLLFPHDQHVDYGFVRYGFAEPVVILGLVLLAGSTLLCVLLARRSPVASFALAWILASLAPYAGLYPTNAYLAEHWLVAPAIGFFLLAGLAVASTAARLPRAGRWLWAAAFLLPLVLGWRTAVQNRTWRDGRTFYTRSLRYAPAAHRVEWYLNLGNHLLEERAYAEAEQAYERAIALDPGDPLPHVSLGVLKMRSGRFTESGTSFASAIAIAPGNALTHKNLASLAVRQGDYRAGIAHLEQAARLNPRDPDIPDRIRKLRAALSAPPGW